MFLLGEIYCKKNYGSSINIYLKLTVFFFKLQYTKLLECLVLPNILKTLK